MHVLVAYDISDNRLRGKIFSFLEENGIHSQKSVFECELDANNMKKMIKFFQRCDLGERDSIVIYPLCHRCARKVHVIGQGCLLAKLDWMIV